MSAAAPAPTSTIAAPAAQPAVALPVITDGKPVAGSAPISWLAVVIGLAGIGFVVQARTQSRKFSDLSMRVAALPAKPSSGACPFAPPGPGAGGARPDDAEANDGEESDDDESDDDESDDDEQEMPELPGAPGSLPARDPAAEAAFWAAALRWRVAEAGTVTEAPGRPDLHLAFATPDDDWAPVLLEVEVYAANRAAEVARLVALGATEGPTMRLGADYEWTVMTDPEGHTFRVTAGSPPRARL
jgi:hypothetical protein